MLSKAFARLFIRPWRAALDHASRLQRARQDNDPTRHSHGVMRPAQRSRVYEKSYWRAVAARNPRGLDPSRAGARRWVGTRRLVENHAYPQPRRHGSAKSIALQLVPARSP